MERKLGMQDREFWSCYFQKFDIILEQTAEKLGGGVGYVNNRSKNIEVYKPDFICETMLRIPDTRDQQFWNTHKNDQQERKQLTN